MNNKSEDYANHLCDVIAQLHETYISLSFFHFAATSFPFFCPVYHRYFYISISISIEIVAYGKQKKYHRGFFKEDGKNEFFICHIYFSIAMAFLSLFIQSLYSCEMKKKAKRI